MSSVRAEQRFADRLQWDALGPMVALLASALGGVLVGYEQVAATGVAVQTGAVSIETLKLLLEGIPGVFIIGGLLLGLVTAGLFGFLGAGLEVIGGAMLMSGNPLGIAPVLVGGILVMYGFYVPWWSYLTG